MGVRHAVELMCAATFVQGPTSVARAPVRRSVTEPPITMPKWNSPIQEGGRSVGPW